MISVIEVQEARTIEIDGNNAHLPESVFITCRQESGDFCIEMDRADLIRALAMELDLITRADADRFADLAQEVTISIDALNA